MRSDYSISEAEVLSNYSKQSSTDSLVVPNNEHIKQRKEIIPNSNTPISINKPHKSIATKNDFDISDQIQKFPTTRYYGSKKRLLPWIYENTKDLEFNSVLDAFGGTASTSLLFQAMGKKVTFNDGLKCNQIMATALLPNNKELLIQKEFEEFIREVTPNKGFISHTFHNDYFTEEENQWLDGIALKIHSLTCEKLNLYTSIAYSKLASKKDLSIYSTEKI